MSVYKPSQTGHLTPGFGPQPDNTFFVVSIDSPLYALR